MAALSGGELTLDIPEVRYVRTAEGVHIAYQVLGQGPMDILFVPGYASNLQWQWELPSCALFLQRLASFGRLICVDRRGSGLSDRFSPDDLPPLEDLVADMEAVLDDVGSERAAVFGVEDGGHICSLLAATHPGRVSPLILFAMDPGGDASGWTPERSDAFWSDLFERIDRSWGTNDFAVWDIGLFHPSRVHDEAFVRWHTANLRLSASPATARALLRMYMETDVRGILPSIAVPTLVVHRIDASEPVQEARVVAAAIPGARLVELPGRDIYWVADADDLLDEVQEFLTGTRSMPLPDRVLATVLFTDIVGSTEHDADLGDLAWADLLARHHATVRNLLKIHGGTEVDNAGDGFFATFEGPARAARCAQAIVEGVRPLGIEVRAGVHTGEVERIDGKIAGMAVNIGARVAAAAEPSTVFVSSTVKDLVVGSGLVFEDAGEHELRGIPDRWRLYRVAGLRP